MSDVLKPYDYINSADGDGYVFEQQWELNDFSMQFRDALYASLRLSEQLINAQNSGEIKMNNIEYEQLLKNYELMRSMINGNE